jgi:diguanylate cyclase (GGDEF)-like protein
MELPAPLLDRIKSCRALPSIPAVVVEVLALCEQDEVGTSEIAAVLARDPALTTKVLKVANSAFYGVRSQVTTLDRAVSIIGINATMSLSLSFSLVGSLKKASAGFDPVLYWRRCIITAAAAKLLSLLEHKAADEYLLAGLIQDIGMLVLNAAYPDQYGRLITSADGNHQKLAQLECESFGVDHAAVGCWLARRWNLPEKLWMSIAVSHDPQIAQGSELADFCKVVTLAGYVAEIWCDQQTIAATAFARDRMREALGMSPEAFEKLLRDVAVALPEMTSNLEMDIGGEESISQLLDQAREALVVLNIRTQQHVREMQDMVNYDRLTLLYNRSYLEHVLPKLFDAAVRSNMPLTVIFADIDNFKRINDNYGHQAGDEVLNSVAVILRSVLRNSDLVARYGGDEFVCILPNTGEEGAKSAAERIRESVASSSPKVANSAEIGLTISLGCATFCGRSQFENGAKLLEEADRCMYVAKRRGRNRVVCSGPFLVDLKTAGELPLRPSDDIFEESSARTEQ